MENLPVNISDRVSSVIDRYCALLDEFAPGIVTGVYVTGSVALGDYHPGASDVDLVGLMPERPDGAAVRALRSVHETLEAERREGTAAEAHRGSAGAAELAGAGGGDQRRQARHESPRPTPWPSVEAHYVIVEDLAALPERGVTVGIQAHGARLVAGAPATPSPILWQELAEHGLEVRGTPLRDLDIAVDRGAVADWCARHLESYWTPWWWRMSQRWSLGGIASLSRAAPVWGVLGVTRMHYTISTGQIASKCGAGEWALERCEPEWRTILSECLRLRRRPDDPSLYRTAIGRRRDMLAYMDLLMTADVRHVLGCASSVEPAVTTVSSASVPAAHADPAASVSATPTARNASASSGTTTPTAPDDIGDHGNVVDHDDFGGQVHESARHSASGPDLRSQPERQPRAASA